MTVSTRTGLGLLLALLLIAADSGQLVAQGTPGSGDSGQPPAGAQGAPMMPPGGMNAGAANKDQFEQGDVEITGGGDDDGVGADAALKEMTPYIIGVVVVLIGIIVYFVKSSGGGGNAGVAAPAASADVPDADDSGGDDGGGDDGGE
jgi:hypothetical protein